MSARSVSDSRTSSYRMALTVALLASGACGRTALLDQTGSGAARIPRGDAGGDQKQSPDAFRAGAPDATRESGTDSLASPDAALDTRPDAPTSSPDARVDGRRDTPFDTRVDTVAVLRFDTRSFDTLSDGAADGGRDANDAGAPDRAAPDTGRSPNDGGPTLKLIAGGPGGPGHQDGTLALAKFSYPEGVASDRAGNLFIAEQEASSGAVIRRIDVASGTVTTLAGSISRRGLDDGTGLAARFLDPMGVVCDSEGNLFVTDFGAHTIRKIEVATGVVTTLAGSAGNRGNQDGLGTDAKLNEPAGIALDGAGLLFVTDFNGHTLRKIVIATGAVTTLAGTAGVQGSQDGAGTAAQFSNPWGVVADGAGNLYVTDAGNQTIRKVVIASGVVTTLAGSVGVAGNKDGFGSAAQFKDPRGLAFDGMGSLYVPESRGHVVRKVVIASGEVTTLAGTPGSVGSRDGKGTEAQFNTPFGVALGQLGALFVLDSYNHLIRKIDPATGVVSRYAGSLPQRGSTDGFGAEARFSNPRGVASDGAGNIFVIDTGNNTIRKVVVATGLVSTLAGSAGQTVSSTDGTGAAARFLELNGITSDGAGNLFVSDGHSVRQVRVATGEVTTLAGSGLEAGTLDGVGALARFSGPRGLLYDGAGVLFVADSFNNAIRKVVVASGEVSTLPCSADGEAGADGGVKEVLRGPWGLATDGAGHLFVSEQYGQSVRQVVLATGKVTTLAGQRGGLVGHADGIGEAAQFRYPLGLVSDGAGGLLVADYGNHVIRKIDIASREVTTVIGDPEQNGLALSPLGPILGSPGGLALDPSGQLFIADRTQNVVLLAQF